MSKNNTVYIGKNKNFWDRNRRSGGYLLRKRAGQIAVSVTRALLLFGLCFMIIQPMLTRFSMSLMEEKDLYDSTVILLPRHVTLENYVHVANLNDLPRSMLNTLWVSLVISLSQIVSCTLVAYGFARYEFPLKKFWFACVLAVIIIPPQTIQSALYMNFANFDILRIFTLFGANAEGLTFGQRIQSVFDGTGTGLIALLTGKTINLRASVAAYILMALTCMGLKNGLYIYMTSRLCFRTRCRLLRAASCSGLYGNGRIFSIPDCSCQAVPFPYTQIRWPVWFPEWAVISPRTHPNR